MRIVGVRCRCALLFVLFACVLSIRGNEVEEFEAAVTPSVPASAAPAADTKAPSAARKFYILYDVNVQEGFNLRRDVLTRIMILVRKLNDNAKNRNKESPDEWTLVLPPFIIMRHWTTYFPSLAYESPLGRNAPTILWQDLFDLDKMKQYIPVMEYHDFVNQVAHHETFTADSSGHIDLSQSHSNKKQAPKRPSGSLISDLSVAEEYSETQLDWILYLRSKPWESKRAREYGVDVVKCPSQQSDSASKGPFDDHFEHQPYSEFTPSSPTESTVDDSSSSNRVYYSSPISAYRSSFSSKLDCFSTFSPFSNLVPVLEHAADRLSSNKPPLVGHGFSADLNGGEQELKKQTKAYKKANKRTYKADKAAVIKDRSFRAFLLDRAETLFWDGSYGQKAWWDARLHQAFAPVVVAEAEKYRQKHLSSPYLAIHLRRGDFVYARSSTVPDLQFAVDRIKQLLESKKLDKVFIASDGTPEDLDFFKKQLPLVTYRNERGLKIHDAQLAIIDQYICIQSSWFVGSFESTFTTVILQEREALGKSPESTYNVFCPPKASNCEQPSRWQVK